MKRFIQQLRKDERGLTLVELLAVVVILGIIATIAFVSIGNVIENSKKDAHISNAIQLISATKLEEASASGPFPTDGYTTAAEAGENQKPLTTIEDLTNPWDTSVSYIGTVTQNAAGDYLVTITGDGGKLAITNATESELAKGRDGNLAP